MAFDGGYVVAFGGGVISFLSPCVLPLVPAYLSVLSGLDAEEIAAGGVAQLRRVTASTALFAIGFTIVFVALGLSASAIGQTLARDRALIERIGGGVLIVMAVVLLLSELRPTGFFQSERRFHPRLERFGWFGAPIAGMAFAFGWTPCIGPILGSVLALAATSAHVVEGGTLLLAYSLGLAVPFLATGLVFARAVGALRAFRRHARALAVAAGIVLAVFGVVMLLGQFSWITVHLQSLASAIGLSFLNRVG
jgi:cytochrome c-type biogenesis protein